MVEKSSLLSCICVVKVSGVERFTATEELFKQEANVKRMNDDFRENFVDKTEDKVEDATLATHRLEEHSQNALIRAQLGDCALIKLCHFFDFLKQQAKDQNGPLLINIWSGCLVYMLDKNEKPWTVLARWFYDWQCNLDAYPIENRFKQRIGSHVVSYNFDK